jgi:TATA-binding protein-associated factor Taf7
VEENKKKTNDKCKEKKRKTRFLRDMRRDFDKRIEGKKKKMMSVRIFIDVENAVSMTVLPLL